LQIPIFDSELRKTFAFYVDANSNYVSILITSDPPPNAAASRGKGASVESDLKFVRYLKTNAKFRIRLTLLLPRRPPLVSDGFFFQPKRREGALRFDACVRDAQSRVS